MKVKIYGTLGPACSDIDTLEKMFRNGMTGMRLNLSHTALRDAEEQIRTMQSAAGRCGIKPELLIDMQGPELRIGRLEKEVVLISGQTIEFICDENLRHDTAAPAGEAAARNNDTDNEKHKAACRMERPIYIPVPAAVMPYLKEGQKVLIDDGRIGITVSRNDTVEGSAENNIIGTVTAGGMLKSRKSICLTGINIQTPTVTAADIENLKDAVRLGVTGIMQPFVRSREDLEAVRAELKRAGADRLRLFAKIENQEGIARLGELLPVCDEIVIARGDLGNSMPLWELPGIQKHISYMCRAAGRDFMVVTQMLYSMEHSPVPTRAEVSDIFNAVLDGAASVMVTGETASGEYPVDVIRYLTNTVREAEHFHKL
ncbi:MAG: pyruvate kinase [Eubacteriales bacterium]|nr:pyruvate kinase [Eubacteriales bacterium]